MHKPYVIDCYRHHHVEFEMHSQNYKMCESEENNHAMVKLELTKFYLK